MRAIVQTLYIIDLVVILMLVTANDRQVALRQGAHGLLQRVQPYMNFMDSGAMGVFELTASRGHDEFDGSAETMDALSTAEQVGGTQSYMAILGEKYI